MSGREPAEANLAGLNDATDNLSKVLIRRSSFDSGSLQTIQTVRFETVSSAEKFEISNS